MSLILISRYFHFIVDNNGETIIVRTIFAQVHENGPANRVHGSRSQTVYGTSECSVVVICVVVVYGTVESPGIHKCNKASSLIAYIVTVPNECRFSCCLFLFYFLFV
jgi:hypothetical protein